MTSLRQQARLLAAADRDARHSFPSDHELLSRRSFQLGLAKGLLQDVLSAAEAPEDVREQCLNMAVARIRREFGETGRLK